MSFRRTLLATAMLALPLAAQAQTVTGLYVAGAAGANWHNDISHTIPGSTAAPFTGTGPNGGVFFIFVPTTLSGSTNVGWAALGSVGWGFGNGLRLEIEGSYRSNDAQNVRYDAAGFPSFAGRGYVTTAGIMANVFYDFRLGGVMPYVGAGAGYAWHRLSNYGATSTAANGLRTVLNGTEGGFAWQVMAGLAIPVRAVPGLAITAEYRYFATLDADIGGSTTSLVNGAVGRFTASVPNENQSVLLGVRYNFGQRPAAPPPPVVRPASSFIVFFDFNRFDLTARAREIVAQAAAAARSQQVTRIEVAGHTDTVGSAQYNLGLSQRRANTVAAELVRLGVPRQAISTAGYGFSRPLVATGPNVREPQNRRVEIVFR